MGFRPFAFTPSGKQGYRDSDDLDWLAIYTSIAHVVMGIAGILSARTVNNTAYIVGGLVAGTLLLMWLVVIKLQCKRSRLARYAEREDDGDGGGGGYEGSDSDSSEW